MNTRTNDQILDAVAGDIILDQTDITPRIMAKIRQENHAIRKGYVSRLALLSLIIAIIILSVSVPGIASAMRQLFGFLPGVGLVDRFAPVRVLQEAVSQEREGVRVTVEQVIALPERTVIQFKVGGIPDSAYPKHLAGSDPQGYKNPCVDPLYLRLPDGTTLTNLGYNALSGTTNVPEYEASFTVEPVPGDINELTLVMPCIEGTERDALPGDWEFPLRLVTAPETMNPAPVFEVLSPTPARSETGPDSVPNLAPADTGQIWDEDIQLALDTVVVLPDGDQVYGSLRWGESAPYSVVTLESFEMTNALEQRIPSMQISPDPSRMPATGERFVPLAFKVAGPVQVPGPVTLTVDRLTASLPVEDARFVFDTGPDPHKNQEWVLNQDIQVGEYSLRLVSVTRLADGYEFSVKPGPGVGCVDLYIQGNNDQRVSCGQGITRVQFGGKIPSGVLTVVIANLEVHLTGSWQAIWRPPEVEQNQVPKP